MRSQVTDHEFPAMPGAMELLRPATPQDLEVLLGNFMVLYYEHDHLEFSREKLDPALRRFMSDPSLGRLWMIQSDQGTPIGYLALSFCFSLECYGREAYVDELFVLPEFRSQGVGSRALQELIRRCPELEVKLLRLEVTQHNERAKELYVRLGFEDHGRTSLMFPEPGARD